MQKLKEFDLQNKTGDGLDNLFQTYRVPETCRHEGAIQTSSTRPHIDRWVNDIGAFFDSQIVNQLQQPSDADLLLFSARKQEPPLETPLIYALNTVCSDLSDPDNYDAAVKIALNLYGSGNGPRAIKWIKKITDYELDSYKCTEEKSLTYRMLKDTGYLSNRLMTRDSDGSTDEARRVAQVILGCDRLQHKNIPTEMADLQKAYLTVTPWIHEDVERMLKLADYYREKLSIGKTDLLEMTPNFDRLLEVVNQMARVCLFEDNVATPEKARRGYRPINQWVKVEEELKAIASSRNKEKMKKVMRSDMKIKDPKSLREKFDAVFLPAKKITPPIIKPVLQTEINEVETNQTMDEESVINRLLMLRTPYKKFDLTPELLSLFDSADAVELYLQECKLIDKLIKGGAGDEGLWKANIRLLISKIERLDKNDKKPWTTERINKLREP